MLIELFMGKYIYECRMFVFDSLVILLVFSSGNNQKNTQITECFSMRRLAIFKIFFYCLGRSANFHYSHLQFFFGNTKFFCPILNFMLFMNVDSSGIRRSRCFWIVRHDLDFKWLAIREALKLLSIFMTTETLLVLVTIYRPANGIPFIG